MRYTITFFSYWHCGTGLSGGFGIDQIVIRNRDGLPFIPGKTLKGLLRDAAENLKEIHIQDNVQWEEFITTVFGTREGAAQPGFRSSCCFFSDGIPGDDLQRVLREEPFLVPHLYRTLASTSITDKGLAKKATLRVKEAVIPLTLHAEIKGFPDDGGEKEKIIKCMQWVKRLGVCRNRGMGRCQFVPVAEGGEEI